MRACIVVRNGQSYNTIHTEQDFLNTIFEKFGRKIYDYFAQYRNTGLPNFKNGMVCEFVGRWTYKKYGRTYWLIKHDEKYMIIGREGIFIEGKDDNIKFFNFIFNWDLDEDD